ncbi:deaminase [Bacteroides ovatus]|nr:deaminase [Bacteroides ovatus]
MAKLQLLAITTLDGYLFDRTVSSPLWDNPNKYILHQNTGTCYTDSRPDVSFISLTQWKKKNEGIYFIEAAPDTISVISSMFRYWLVDEIILFVAPYIQGDGIRLFTEIPGPSSWEMTGNKCFRSGICRLVLQTD